MQLTIDKIIELTGGKLLKPTPETTISGVATLADACRGEISFLGNEKYFQAFLKTGASAILVPPGLPDYPKGKDGAPAPAFIEVANPSLAFNSLVDYFVKVVHSFEPGISPHAYVDESAQLDPSKVRIGPGVVIEAGAKIGDGCDIGAGCIIGRDCVIGENCKFHQRVTIRERCIIGKHVVIQPGAVIGADGFGFLLNKEVGYYDTIDQVGIVVIGDYVDIGANSAIDRARFGRTVIGEGCKIDNLVQIGHNVTVGKHCIIVAQTGIAGSTKLGNYVTVAAQSGIAGHLSIGDQAIIGAKTGVITNLAAGGTYWGMPAATFKETTKQIICLRKLPQAMKEMKALQKQVDALQKLIEEAQS